MKQGQVYLIETTINGKDVPVGTLSKNDEILMFQYDLDTWIKQVGYEIDPALPLDAYPNQCTVDQAWGFLTDMGTDSWGKRLQDLASQGNYLDEIDYVIGISDYTRLGALRIKNEKGEYLSPEKNVPHLTSLKSLEEAIVRTEKGLETSADIALLLMPGSSLGGAHPKAVVEHDGKLYLAKFQSRFDAIRVSSWEAVMMQLSKNAGIRTANFELIGAETDRPVLISERFDRNGAVRIPFMSAKTMMQADKEHVTRSYLGLIQKTNSFSCEPKKDSLEIWKRMMFNVLAGNTDDHLLNHGFIRIDKGWRVSPAYDLNPDPRYNFENRFHMLPFVDAVNKPINTDLEMLLDIADQAGINKNDRNQALQQIVTSIDSWEQVARSYKLQPHEIQKFEGGFRNVLFENAKAFSYSTVTAPTQKKHHENRLFFS